MRLPIGTRSRSLGQGQTHDLLIFFFVVDDELLDRLISNLIDG